LSEHAPDPAAYGNADRMQAMSKSMHDFNTDTIEGLFAELFDVIMLPMRDGLTILRYKSSHNDHN
jgi:hypothetical protein